MIVLMITLFLFIMFLLVKTLHSKPSRRVYLVDYACFKPKKSQQRTREESVRIMRTFCGPNINDESARLISKATMASGIGDFTYGPEPLLRDPPEPSLKGSWSEAEAVIYGVVDAVLDKTGVKAENIGMLVVNSCLFCPVPSLSDMIVNKYKLREDVKSFDVTGMGCSAGLVAIDLAHRLLQVHENANVLVVSTEVLTESFYNGNDLSKLTINCVMRVGGAGILLSNRPSNHYTSKYELIHSVRTTTASSDRSYKCIFEEEDSQGMQGYTVNKDLVVEAKNAIESHLKTLGHLILPKSEQLLFGLNYLIRKLPVPKKQIKEYTPSFRRATDHFLPHVGAANVIEELRRSLKLDVEAPRMTLYRFGNTSSSSVWYELAYIEAKGMVKKGNRIWQMAFGSGFKCNSVVWKALKNVGRAELGNPWSDEIHDFPVELTFNKSNKVYAFYEQPK